MSECQVGPHEFRPLKRWRNRGRCEACYLVEQLHPVRGWTQLRPLKDDSFAPPVVPDGGAAVERTQE